MLNGINRFTYLLLFQKAFEKQTFEEVFNGAVKNVINQMQGCVLFFWIDLVRYRLNQRQCTRYSILVHVYVWSYRLGSNTHIVFVPSQRDLHHDQVYPQPPYVIDGYQPKVQNLFLKSGLFIQLIILMQAIVWLTHYIYPVINFNFNLYF